MFYLFYLHVSYYLVWAAVLTTLVVATVVVSVQTVASVMASVHATSVLVNNLVLSGCRIVVVCVFRGHEA